MAATIFLTWESHCNYCFYDRTLTFWVGLHPFLDFSDFSQKIQNIYYCDYDFRMACSVMNNSDIYVGIEGGFSHAAAALRKKAVIYFGGWIDPKVTGYDFHHNIYVNIDGSPCGSMSYLCDHCEICRKKISVDLVYDLIIKELNKKNNFESLKE